GRRLPAALTTRARRGVEMTGPVSALHERPDHFSPTPRLAPGRLGNQRHVDHDRSSPCARLRSPLAKRRMLHTTLSKIAVGCGKWDRDISMHVTGVDLEK